MHIVNVHVSELIKEVIQHYF
uniref:Uncharacterized protein n=1 Tax=Rhizophora mucronata TaxID=61149 RepID=A0A2P2Q918_RHIMU